jgi:hypothetical protein
MGGMRSQDSLVRTVNGFGLDSQGTGVLFLAGERDVSSQQNA